MFLITCLFSNFCIMCSASFGLHSVASPACVHPTPPLHHSRHLKHNFTSPMYCSQIEPREEEIGEMKETIKSMDAELERYHKSNAGLDLLIQVCDALHWLVFALLRGSGRLCIDCVMVVCAGKIWNKELI